METTTETTPATAHETTSGTRSRSLFGGLAALAVVAGSFFAASAVGADSPADDPVAGEADNALVGATFVPVTPYRAFDSRSLPICSGQPGPFGPNESVVLDVGIDENDSCNVKLPISGVVAVTYNITVVNTVGRGFLSVTPVGSPAGGTSAVNWTETGQIVPNGGVVGVGDAFEVDGCCIVVEMGPNGSTNFFIDITGYYIM
jgi:hypothetical protein